MGNIAYHMLSSVSTITIAEGSVSEEYEVLSKAVTCIEERCENLFEHNKPKIGSHSYLILHTTDGDLIRIDYSNHDLEPYVTFNYQEISKSDCFRLSKVNKYLTVSEGLKIVRKHCVKNKYDFLEHNCQHVARDSFVEISGINTKLLRDDYLRWFKKSVPYELRRDYGFDDQEMQHAKLMYRKFKEYGENSGIEELVDPVNSKEGYANFISHLMNKSKDEQDLIELYGKEKEWSKDNKKRMFEEIMRRMRKSDE